jgi:hypothetical protein
MRRSPGEGLRRSTAASRSSAPASSSTCLEHVEGHDGIQVLRCDCRRHFPAEVGFHYRNAWIGAKALVHVGAEQRQQRGVEFAQDQPVAQRQPARQAAEAGADLEDARPEMRRDGVGDPALIVDRAAQRLELER